jgi:hypothetical protein
MRFTLHYRGSLKANRGAKDKHALRRYFHGQLRCLWEQPPLLDYRDYLSENVKSGEISLIHPIGQFKFAPLVSSRLHMIAELDITLLRPGPPGNLISQSGDIDNRLKTLLDALKVPKEPTALPAGEVPLADEDPFFCLLEDDTLITAVSVATDRLLEHTVDSSEVVLLVHVTTRTTRAIWGNTGLGS